MVTGDGSEVIGRDPLTGEPHWRYARNLPLCTVGSGWDRALAVYQRGQFCSEVTALDGGTGIREAQRNADTTAGVQLLDNGMLAAATSTEFLEVWRSDLVRTLEYGVVQAPEQPERQPRAGCRYGSFALVTGRLGSWSTAPVSSPTGSPCWSRTARRPTGPRRSSACCSRSRAAGSSR